MRSAPVGARCGIAINGRAAVRRQIGGVERYAREMAARLPALHPGRYRVIRPAAGLAHRAGHLWEQAVLPAAARECALLYSPANLAPVISRGSVVVIHDAAALRHPQAYSREYVAYQRRMLPLLARRARLVITVSRFSRDELVELLELSPERIRIVPGGVDERFAATLDAAPVRRRYGLRREYVLAVGTSSQRKNFAALEPVARALGEQGLELVQVGSGRGYLRGEQAGIRRIGYVPDEHLPALYAGARALVMPSRYEGFGLPCLEAMAAGVPVVAARAGALPETVGEAGLLVDPDDARGWIEATLGVVSREALRTRLSAAGRRRAAAMSWQRTAELTHASLSELLQADRQGGS